MPTHFVEYLVLRLAALALGNLTTMKKSAVDFLTDVLGTEGAKALSRTAAKEPSLGALLVPRAALAWVNQTDTFEGLIPGIPNSYLKFQKSEGVLTGIVTLPELNYEFTQTTPEHVAAALAVTVGSDLSEIGTVRDVTLSRLGKSIDVLVKAQSFARTLAKKILDPAVGYNIREEEVPNGLRVHAYDRHGKHLASAWFQSVENQLQPVTADTNDEEEDAGLKQALYDHAKKFSGKNIQKTELPGSTHKPTQQQGPQAAEAPTKQPQMKKPKLPKVPALKVEKSETAKECPACGGTQFQANKFRGCMCHRDLAKHVKTTSYSDGVVLEFSTREAFVAFRKLLKD